MQSIVVHYKELALKGKNRSWFIRMLVRNLQHALAGLHVAAIRQVMGRIEVELGDGAQWPEVRDRLGKVFGIAYFSPAGRGFTTSTNCPWPFSATSAIGRPNRSGSRSGAPTSAFR